MGTPAGIPQAIATAIAHVKAGRLAEADMLCARILQAAPHHAEALHLRGTIAYQVGRPDAAIALITRATQADPTNAAAFSDLGMIHNAIGRYQDAETYLKKAVAIDPKSAKALINLGNLYGFVGHIRAAEPCYRKAIALDPRLLAARHNLSHLLTEDGRPAEAIAVARDALAIDSANAQSYCRLGAALGAAGKMREAEAAYEKALALAPDDPNVQLNLAQHLAKSGQIEDAARRYRALIAKRPEFVPAYFELTKLVNFTDYDAEVRRIEALASRDDLAPKDQIQLAFGAGKALEDVKEYDRAFALFTRANALQRRSVSYAPDRDAATFADIRSAFSGKTLARLDRPATSDDRHPTPIFVVGMPRSGTSLLEQILASHPAVTGAGELSLVHMLGDELRQAAGEADFVSALAKADVESLDRLGQKYLAEVSKLAPGAGFVVDKMPENFAYAGLIRLMLPHARIVHCRRNPADTCLSIFKNLFSEGKLRFAYDLDELAGYYREYERLMSHWREVMPETVHEIDYEALVADQRTETEKLLSYCGLEWSDACLEFFKTRRMVRTVSFAQVRQPINARSVGLAQRYGEAAKPLLDALARV